MSKGKWIDPEVKKHYISRALQERNAIKDGKLTLDTLVRRVTKELKDAKKTPPAPSTLKREMSLIINREPSAEDQPWHMGTYKVYAPSAAGLVAIWKAYRFVIGERATLSEEDKPTLELANIESDAMLTIRQAKWITRLDPVVRMVFAQLDKEVLTPLVIEAAIDYAADEILCEVMGVPFNTQTVDGNLARGVIIGYDVSDVKYLRERVFYRLCHSKRTTEEMKRSFDDPFVRERAELVAESMRKKPGDMEFWGQYNERLDSISDRRKTRDLDEWEREEEARWHKSLGETYPQLRKEIVNAFRAAVPIVLSKPATKWTDEERGTVDEYNRLESYAESLKEGQDKGEPIKKAKKSRGKKGAKKP